MEIDRCWLLTWTAYGTWLPGAERGFVGNIRNEDGMQVSHNISGTAFAEDLQFTMASRAP